MRKIITICIIFAALLSVGIWEIVYSSKLYDDVYCSLVAIEKSMEEHEHKLDNPETLELVNKMSDRWEKGREIVFCLGNHTVLRNVDEKLISLKAMIETNHKEDAFVNIKISLSIVEAIRNDTYPIWSNLF